MAAETNTLSAPFPAATPSLATVPPPTVVVGSKPSVPAKGRIAQTLPGSGPADPAKPAGPAQGRVAQTLNFTLVQALIGAFVIPITLVTDGEGKWVFGPDACRAWLLLQILLLAASAWTLVLMTLDHLILLASTL